MQIKKALEWLINPPEDGPSATILLRFRAGGVFLWEGILKFVYANQGVGLFTKIGIPSPGEMATFVALLEIVGGPLLITGFITRLIAVPGILAHHRERRCRLAPIQDLRVFDNKLTRLACR